MAITVCPRNKILVSPRFFLKYFSKNVTVKYNEQQMDWDQNVNHRENEATNNLNKTLQNSNNFRTDKMR